MFSKVIYFSNLGNFISHKILSKYINKVKLTGDSRLQIPQQLMNIATNENIEASDNKLMMVVKLG